MAASDGGNKGDSVTAGLIAFLCGETVRGKPAQENVAEGTYNAA